MILCDYRLSVFDSGCHCSVFECVYVRLFVCLPVGLSVCHCVCVSVSVFVCGVELNFV